MAIFPAMSPTTCIGGFSFLTKAAKFGEKYVINCSTSYIEKVCEAYKIYMKSGHLVI